MLVEQFAARHTVPLATSHSDSVVALLFYIFFLNWSNICLHLCHDICVSADEVKVVFVFTL